MFIQHNPLVVIYFAISLLVGLSFHEASHAFTADRLGDPTARNLGRLTLNPIAHLDPLGAFVIVISSLAGFGIGWGKPVPVNPRNLRNGPITGMAIVALAGPVSNIVLAFLCQHILGLIPGFPVQLTQTLVFVNVLLAIFNMIPIPPLDGYRVLLGLLPNGPAYKLMRLEAYGPGILILLVFLAPGVLNSILIFFSHPIFRIIGA